MNWEPVRADNSILRATVTLSLTVPLDANAFDELVVAARKAGQPHGLTERVETLEAIELPPVPDGQFVRMNFPGPPPRRVAFQQRAEKRVVAEVSVGQQTIQFVIRQYQRWAGFFSIISDAFEKISVECPQAAQIRFLRLEYLDRFKATDSAADHFEIISRQSDYVTPSIRDKAASLHVHSGWFDFEGDDVRALTNVNIDAVDLPKGGSPTGQRSITILTMKQLENIRGGSLTDVLLRLDKLHHELNDVYGGIITSEAANRVSLDV